MNTLSTPREYRSTSKQPEIKLRVSDLLQRLLFHLSSPSTTPEEWTLITGQIFDLKSPHGSSFVEFVISPQPKLGQNLLYDINFLWTKYGIPVRNVEHDTMLLHHSLYPESEKGLAFLGSVYTNESSWKLMRKGSMTIKRDE